MYAQFQTRRSAMNQLLDALPDGDYRCLEPFLKKVNLPPLYFLYKSDVAIKYVYFPITAMASVIATTIGGQPSEIEVMGCEGMFGVEVLMGVDSSAKEVLIQPAGGAWRIKTEEIRKEFKHDGAEGK